MNILITGASRGIGHELARAFAAMGGHTIVAVSRNLDKLEQLARNCNGNYPSSVVVPLRFDLSDSASIEPSLAEAILHTVPGVDILVNNAGLLVNRPFMETELPELEKMIRVNYYGPALIIRALLPFMGKMGRGHVVNISSMGGVQGSAKFAGLAGYSASKSALATLTECLAEELKERNVSFNCVALGAVQTEMLQEAFPGYNASITPEELAPHLASFCINGMHYCNGKILPFSLSTP